MPFGQDFEIVRPFGHCSTPAPSDELDFDGTDELEFTGIGEDFDGTDELGMDFGGTLGHVTSITIGTMRRDS